MSFAPHKSEPEEDDQIQVSKSKFFKSVRSVWKKAGKFRRWRRTMDLEKARKDQETDLAEEAQEDALFYPLPGLEPAASTANTTATSNPSSQCVCVRYNSNLPVYNPANARMPRMEDPKVALFRQNSQLASSKKASGSSKRANFQVDYINYLIPGLENIFNCPFYWGKMDRYEAEALLADKPEGSFLLRDSAQENYVFSVSFRRYSRSLHARIEETQHKFSFDCHDPGVHASRSIRGLLDYYKDPLSCMFFEPMLLFPILRRKPFSLQELARTVICDNTEYEGVSYLPIPKTLKTFLREYHYKHKFDSRSLELSPSVLSLPRKSEDIEEDSDNDNVVEDFEED